MKKGKGNKTKKRKGEKKMRRGTFSHNFIWQNIMSSSNKIYMYSHFQFVWQTCASRGSTSSQDECQGKEDQQEGDLWQEVKSMKESSRIQTMADKKKNSNLGGCFTKMLSALIVMLKVKIYKIQNTKYHWWITSSARHLRVICPMQ